MKQELTTLNLFMVFFRRRKAIILLVFLFGSAGVVYSLFTPHIYRAESRILPPSQGGSMAAAMLAQMGGLAGLAGITPGATSGELLMGVLRGATVVDKIIDRFDLMILHEQESRLRMRQRVTTRILHTTQDVRSGIVTVAVLDEESVRAAQMANAFVEELKNVMQSLAIGEAAQRRLFFEQQMLEARVILHEAEDGLSRFQEESGLVAVAPQVAAMVTAIASLRAEIAAKEVELSSLRTFASANNPSLRRAESELVALRSALENLEREQGTTDRNTLMTSLSEAPQLGLEHQRRVRDVQHAAAMYELMLRQYEAAKIDESREAMVVQVVDSATPPDFRFSPRRTAIVIFATLLGLCLGMLWALFAHYVESLRNDPKQAQVLQEIREAFLLKKQH